MLLSNQQNAYQNSPNKGQVITPVGPNKMLNIRGNICHKDGRIFAEMAAEYSQNGGRIFTKMAAEYSSKWRPNIHQNGGRIFIKMAAEYSSKWRPNTHQNNRGPVLNN
jgi:hypothetical protein